MHTRTPWSFAADVPAGQTVHVKIQVFDEDLISDDEGDAKPGPGSAIELDVDPTTGLWSGDFAWPQTCSRPNLEGGTNNVNLCFQVGFDADDDGLLDVWERNGVDTDNDGAIDLNVAAMGASPLRKDVFLEIDHLLASNHTHRRHRDAGSQVVTSFAERPSRILTAAAVCSFTSTSVRFTEAARSFRCPDRTASSGPTGDLGGGNIILEAGNETIEAFREAKGNAVDFADLKAANFNFLREPIFRYTIFGHQTNARLAANDCTTGQANQTRRDFLVTLGGVGINGACWGTDINGHSVGFVNQQAGTLMHEMGHTLGLRHGGDARDPVVTESRDAGSDGHDHGRGQLRSESLGHAGVDHQQ